MSSAASLIGAALQAGANSTGGGAGSAGGAGFPGIYIGGAGGTGSISCSSPYQTIGTSLTPQQQQDLKDLYDKVQQITGTTFTFPSPATKEELTELDALEQLRQQDMTQQQVRAFKRVPAAIRQRLVDDILWTRELADLEVVDQGKSARQLELESKKSLGTLYGTTGQTLGRAGWIHGGISSTIITSFPGYPMAARPLLPSRMTEEDVIQAHNEATMEEECLNQE